MMTENEKKITENLIRGMSKEELQIVLENIPDSILMAEVKARHDRNLELLNAVRALMGVPV